ncbi:hypothetical protein LDJ79_21245 [Vibrio tritonius]|uniref:AAA+ ATPase domain-containing protein n=1 Tax=Vibrio tritonius TaxID=1435069 RepID=A0ABS7YSI7_9VIBR|nr:hypothetical protein [Vibrio tritonius]MCA2018655.1 hypothetical protein [Vibrio tritonius]
MSGQDGNRGYLIQSIIALLESLNDNDWTTVTIEADHISDKVDVAWQGIKGTKVSQVKSSINQISKSNAVKWASELKEQSKANEYVLILVGPCSQSVAKMGSYDTVLIPCPKNMDINGLLREACHLLAVFLEKNSIYAQSFLHREAMANALVTKLSTFASHGISLSRSDFVSLLRDWCCSVSRDTNYMWEQVDFKLQRGLENAIAGRRLGPSDVVHCPELSICREIKTELDRSHLYWITGKQGCGKSITAWQVAKKFYDEGFIVCRPDYSSEPVELLKSLVNDFNKILVIDDAQQYSNDFIFRLSERACSTLKIIFTSTLIDFNISSPAIISPSLANKEIQNALINRRSEVLPIVQSFDDDVSDSYMGTSLENRLIQCSKQNSPWEFFWVLRGGWKTARKEFERIQQITNANLIISIIAARQISSCDAGVSRSRLIKYTETEGVKPQECDKAISQLESLGLITISDDILRTKHISYADRLISECFSRKNYSSWPTSVDMVLKIVLDDTVALEGIYWLLQSIDLTDATRFESKKLWLSMLEPLKTRCKQEWKQSEWAIGCYYYIIRFFGISSEELNSDEEHLLQWFSSGFGRTAIFSKNIANHLINLGNGIEADLSSEQVKHLFEKVDSDRLVRLTNEISVSDFYSLGELISRLTYFRPTWVENFLLNFDWIRAAKLINNAMPEYQYSVDKLIECVFLLANSGKEQLDYQYVTDSIPFIIKCYERDPINVVNDFDGVFWHCLGFGPHFLRGGRSPTTQQVNIAKDIISKLSPELMANAMYNLVSRDLENLARSLSVISEIDDSFIQNLLVKLDQNRFNKSIHSDWKNQSDELQHLIRFFGLKNNKEPARSWISLNRDNIEGALHPIFIGLAPEIAIYFFENGMQLKLFDKENRWHESVFALASLADHDKNTTIAIVERYLDEVEDSLYKLTLDPPHIILNFFRIIHSLSIHLFSKLVCRINVEDPRALKTINQLHQSQENERKNYLRLARLAMGLGGEIASLGQNLNDKLKG